VGVVVEYSRNEQWRSLLDECQLDVLVDFVRSHAEKIDGIFPGGRDASRDLATLRSETAIGRKLPTPLRDSSAEEAF
jgi:hypothetical protein